MLALLAEDEMLVKRPMLIGDDFVLVGFKEADWERRWKNRNVICFLRTDFSISIRLIFQDFSINISSLKSYFSNIQVAASCLLFPAHRQSPASNLRLPGPFIFSSASHSNKFSCCGRNM